MDIKLFAFSLVIFHSLTNFNFFYVNVNACECAIDEGGTHQVYNKNIPDIARILHMQC